MNTSWDLAIKFVKNNGGGRFLTKVQLEQRLGGPLPVKIKGCRVCGQNLGEKQFQFLYYIPLYNRKMFDRAFSQPFAGAVQGAAFPFSVIGLCRNCIKCWVRVEV